MSAESFDVIVLGVGGIGLAAVWQLAQRGVKVCGLEQFSISHDRGSSHGGSRAIRKAYFEHPDYVPLLNRAYELWAQLEAETQQQLVNLCGMVFAGAPGSTAIQGLERCYGEHALPHERLSAAEAGRRFEAFTFRGDHTVFYDPLGGYVHPEAAIASMVGLARAAGADVREQTRVLSWRAFDAQVEVQTDLGSLRAAHLLITAGPWAGQVLAELNLPLEIRRKVQLWYTSDQMDRMRDVPVWYIDNEYGGVYGFPAGDKNEFKVAVHDGGEPMANPESLVRDLLEGDETLILRCLSEIFPWLEPRLVKHAACMYTCTPDEHFITDQHPAYKNVTFAAGFSGHGFKFTPVIGEILADLATAQASPLPFDFLRLRRLTKMQAGA